MREGAKPRYTKTETDTLIAAEATARDTAIGVETTARGVAIATHAALFGLHNKIIRKTATESIISSTTLTNDAELKFSVLANEVWQFWLLLRYNRQAGGAQNAAIAFTVPTNGAIAFQYQTGNSNTELDGTTTFNPTQIDTPSVKYCHSRYLYIGGANAGTVQFQWAQQVSEAKYHYFLLNSYIIAHQLV